MGVGLEWRDQKASRWSELDSIERRKILRPMRRRGVRRRCRSRNKSGDKKKSVIGSGRREKQYLDVPEDFLAHNRDILAEVLSEILRLVFSRVSKLAIRGEHGRDLAYRRDRWTNLSSPFEDERELGEVPDLAAGLLLGVDGLELSLCARELDLAGEGLVELGQLVEIVADGPETLGFFDCGGYVSQLLALPKDDLFCFVVEKADEGLGPGLIDREVELELLLWGAIRMAEDGDVGLEDPGRGLWGSLYGEGTLGGGGQATEAKAR